MAYAPRSGGEGGGEGGRERRGRRRENPENRQERQDGDELKDKLVTINRVAKVVKGGRRFSFAALVVVGDEKGRVGWGAGKAREVPEAIRKATERAKRTMIRVPMREGRTLHHDVIGHFGAGRVVLRAAPAGTGIIAGGPMRAVFDDAALVGRYLEVEAALARAEARLGVIPEDAARAIRARQAGEPLAEDVVFPTVEDGLGGMRFIDACVRSSARNGSFVKL